jgi:hypothetical protein
MFDFVKKARQTLAGYGQLSVRSLEESGADPKFVRDSGGVPPSPPSGKRFSVLGLDLGQSQDHSAGVMVDRQMYESGFNGPRDEQLWVRYVREWPTGYDYTAVAEDALDLNPSVIVPEFNGVGRPFVDILRKRAAQRGYIGRIMPVVTAASSAKLQEHFEARGRHLTVPKVDLVSSITAAQQRKLLRTVACSPMCPNRCGCDIPKMFKELRDFQYRISRAANVQFGNVEKAGLHDDLVIALGLACFYSSTIGWRSGGVMM